MLGELFEGMMHSTPQGFVGVGLIFIYFVVIFSTAIYRVKKVNISIIRILISDTPSFGVSYKYVYKEKDRHVLAIT